MKKMASESVVSYFEGAGMSHANLYVYIVQYFEGNVAGHIYWEKGPRSSWNYYYTYRLRSIDE